MSAATVLWNARVVDGEGIRERMAVRLESGRIASVTPIGGEPPSDAVHLGGKSLLPGLIDVHSHFMSDLDRSPGFGPAPPRHGDLPRPRALGHYILAAATPRP